MSDPVSEVGSSSMSAERSLYRSTPARRRARRMAVALAIVFYVGGIGTTFAVSMANGRATGFGDGTLAASCFTPGGPYYPPDMPAEERNCPNGSEGRAQAPSTGPFRDFGDVGRVAISLAACAVILYGWIRLLSNIGEA